ncbi:MAG: UDP-glucose 4-epimerase [Candidatus Harrisonbacteria bacterium CG10_big_fil_rev_8_21_14_0_10_49_15]|uniref:UDP-glucose 4-epimerase n=1 Tax=Candidatus Harrisonbacteria bacterium CG10_big_fil_rev_8_21_14_0_10_49_15 TaxID=1974587 RepID=A0A2H0ULZ7_9BACT|nr:MAG: UDP-glucose 4-epimerase [Candidatus Harrisonbacteria bacterium CG10_big_fil_rev_8_21_14_0_10_49_15]
MKIIVTGGAGFIGSHIVDAYIAAGHDVVVIDNLSTGRRDNLNPQAKFYEADICDKSALDEIFKTEKPQIVNHHAAQISVTESEKDPANTEAVNYDGTINLLNQPGIERFIFASTGGAMFNDSSQLPASEQTPARPISVYGQSKLKAENAVIEQAEKQNFTPIILRYANVFGPRQNPHGESGVVAIFCDLAQRGGQPTIYRKETTRDYVFVADVVHANELAVKKGSGIYHIATGVETTNQTVFEAVRDKFDWQTNPLYAAARPGEVLRSVLRNNKAELELGWTPQINFTEGIRLIYDR